MVEADRVGEVYVYRGDKLVPMVNPPEYTNGRYVYYFKKLEKGMIL